MQLSFSRVLAGFAVIVGILVVALTWGSWGGPAIEGNTLHIYCAAGLRKPVEEIAADYQQKYGVEIKTEFAGSGALLSSMRASGKGDIYIAADSAYFDDARKFDLLAETAPIATQSPVVVIKKGNSSFGELKSISEVLAAQPRISLGNPKVAAISRVAQKTLGDETWNELWEAKRVARDTVNQVVNDVVTGAADLGIVWDATANQSDQLEILPLPELKNAGNSIGVAVARESSNPTRALHFLRYLTATDRGLQNFRKYKYDVVEGDDWSERPTLRMLSGGLMRPPVEEIIAEFEEREGVKVEATFNGCGILVGQLRTGAKADVYFSCDVTFMDQVNDLFPQSEKVVGTDMVIIVHKKNAEKLKIKELSDLAQPGIKVGVAHPEQSTLGFLTKNLLETQGVYEQVSKNVRDTPSTADRLVEHVVFESLDAAIVYRANTTLQQDKLEVITIGSTEVNAEAVQPVAVSPDSKHRYLAQRLVERILSSQDVFEKYGFRWLAPEK